MSVLQQIGNTLAAEFALPDVETATIIAVRLLTAVLLGAALGIERERKRRAAGLKTHILVSLGSALFVLAPLQAGVDQADVTRVMQGIVSGIGFLGAGAIIKLDRGERVEGLTTAAGIWMTSAIGMAAGMGREIAAVITTLIALGVFALIPRLMRNDGPGERGYNPHHDEGAGGRGQGRSTGDAIDGPDRRHDVGRHDVDRRDG